MKAIILCLIQAVLNIIGVALVRKAVVNFSYTKENILRELISFQLIAGVFLIGVGFLFTMYILSSYELSYYQPLSSGLTFIVTLLISYYFLKEDIGIRDIVGIVIIMIGCLIISWQK